MLSFKREKTSFLEIHVTNGTTQELKQRSVSLVLYTDKTFHKSSLQCSQYFYSSCLKLPHVLMQLVCARLIIERSQIRVQVLVEANFLRAS